MDPFIRTAWPEQTRKRKSVWRDEYNITPVDQSLDVAPLLWIIL